MKCFFKILLLLLLPAITQAQEVLQKQQLPDSLRKAFQIAATDEEKFQVARVIYTYYEETNRDSALYYAVLRYNIAKQHNRKIEEAYTQGQMGYQQVYLGRFSEALINLTEALLIAGDKKTEQMDTWDLTYYKTPGKSRLLTLSMLNHMYGHLMLQTGNKESIHYFKEGRKIGLEIDNDFRVTVGDMVLASTYVRSNNIDSALFFAREGEKYGIRGDIKKYLGYIWFVMGDIYLQKKDNGLALSYYHRALKAGNETGNVNGAAMTYDRLINFYKLQNNPDSALYYAINNLAIVRTLGSVTSTSAGEINIAAAYQQLATAYSLQKNKDSANKYFQLALAAKDKLHAVKINNLADFQQLTLNEQLRLQAAETERKRIQNRNRTYLLLSGIAVVIIIMLLIYRNNRQKQKAFDELQKQKSATDQQKEKADMALQELKSTQSQLIQSEKMASLGELTAGIAHEIQNPLNFVNNFSDVNKEMLEELKAERLKQKAERDDGTQDQIINDLIDNEQKINHHGKRADAIVKGMLQHSRTSTGKKEPTSINALAEEYLRLSYHGLRGKDNTFNADFKTELDESIGKIEVVAQDIGRVLLNLFNNAFYAVNERQRAEGKGFKPAVSVSTKKIGDEVLISVRDNGSGISKNIIDKIFQPFFTTKPTGQGTGLGLSLSYDIIKAHGGEIRVETKEGEGSEFIIQLQTN